MTASTFRCHAFARAFAAGSIALPSACGGGGDAGTPAQTVTPTLVVPTTVTLTGTAATGAPAANAAITAICAGATTSFTATAAADGGFSITVSQAPCLLRATFGTPAQSLYSLTTTTGVVDISPFSDRVVATWGHALPDAVFAGIDATHPLAIDAIALADAIALVRRRVANAGVNNIAALDLLHQAFNARTGDPYDDAIEALRAATTPQAALRADVAAGRDAAAVAVPTAPTISLAESGDGVVRISWPQAQAGVTYAVYYDVNPNVVIGNAPLATQLAGTGTSPVTVSGLVNGTDYIFVVRATNAAGTVSSGYAVKAPKVLVLQFAYCPAGGNSCFDPTRADGNFGAFYTSMAYTRYGGSDHYVAVKSDRQIMHMVDDLAPVHTQFAGRGVGPIPLNGVAASPDGVVLAVGDSGALMRSDDGGLQWTSVSIGFQGTTAVTTRFASVAYGNGVFVAVGSYGDTFGVNHDIIVTHPAHFACPAGASCTTFSGTTAYTPLMYSQLNQVAFGNGRFVVLGSNDSYTDAAGARQPTTAGYTSTDAAQWAFATPDGTAAFSGGADKIVYFANLFWGLQWQSDTGRPPQRRRHRLGRQRLASHQPRQLHQRHGGRREPARRRRCRRLHLHQQERWRSQQLVAEQQPERASVPRQPARREEHHDLRQQPLRGHHQRLRVRLEVARSKGGRRPYHGDQRHEYDR